MSSRVFPHLGALLVLFALVLIPAVCGQPLNQLPNGSFEGGSFAGWSGAGGAVGNTNDAHDGLWSAQLTTQTLSASLDLASVVEAKCTAWLRFIRTTGVDTGWGGFRLEVLSQDWKTLAHSGWLLERTHGTNWFKIALRFTPTTAQTRLQVGYFGDAARVMTTRVDDLRVFAKPASNTAPTVSATLTPAILPAVPGMQDFQVVADDADGAIERVYWDFGDGACSTATRGSRRVGVPGAFEARLLVADDDGAVTATSIRWQAEDHRFPTLQVDAPVDEVTTNQSAAVRLSGTCTGDQPLLLVSTDRGILAPVHGTTTWSSDVPLLAGWNRVLIQVRDAAGRIVTRERRIRRVSAAPLAILDLELGPSSVSRWTMLEVTCSITNLVATHTRFPYEVDRTPGLEWVDGITVDGVFTPDDWRTVFRRPGFLQQRYLRALKGGEEWMYPTNPPVWTVRFAPPHPGQWRGRVEATDASGSAVSTEGVFVVTQPVDPHNHGPSAVSATDSRYFEYADGTTFLGMGHNLAFLPERYSHDAEDRFTVMGRGNQQFFRLELRE